MRIALVTESFYPAVDGATTTVKAVADRLVETGHTVLVVAPAPGLTSYRGCRIARIAVQGRIGSQVREVFSAFRPDLVHVMAPGAVGRKALKHAGRLGIPTVAVNADAELHADRHLVTATWLLDGRPDASLWTPGVDTAAFAPHLRDGWLHRSWSRSRSGPLVVVGYVGSLRRHHGVRTLKQLGEVPGIRPVLVGDGPQRSWLRARLPDAKLTGSLQTGDLSRAMASFDLLIHPGAEETCAHALRQAAASGVPVVAPRSGGAIDVVRSLETGLLYDPTSEHALSRAVAAVAADQHRVLMGRRGRELALDRPWRIAVDELVEAHHGVLVGHKRFTRSGAA